MYISIFGGSTPKPHEPSYQFAYDLGKRLAQEGFTILTGGYMGTMEASSRGAAECGGHVVGVTCTEIENWRNARHNPWVKEVWTVPTLHERIIKLIDACDAAIALPGGPGTLAEITLMWNRLQINAIPERPIVLVGNSWKKVLETFFEEQKDYIPDFAKDFIKFSSSIDEIIEIINTWNA